MAKFTAPESKRLRYVVQVSYSAGQIFIHGLAHELGIACSVYRSCCWIL